MTVGQATYGNLSRSLPQPLVPLQGGTVVCCILSKVEMLSNERMLGCGLRSAGRRTFCGLRPWFMSVTSHVLFHLGAVSQPGGRQGLLPWQVLCAPDETG